MKKKDTFTSLLQEKKNFEYLAAKLESILSEIDCIASNQMFGKEDKKKIEQTIETFMYLEEINTFSLRLTEKQIIQKLKHNAAEN